LVKDFYTPELFTTQFIKYGFSRLQVEPNMIIKLQDSWRSFEDYKEALKSKYRVKVNKADSKSAQLHCKLLDESEFKLYKNQLQSLYENTIKNANFNAQVLNLNTYLRLRKAFKKDFTVTAYFLADQLVGFATALVNDKHLDAHFIGLNYDLNKTHSIYPRILNDYIRLGIKKRLKQINFGRTASEIK
jgi:predicted N-acyltransferase